MVGFGPFLNMAFSLIFICFCILFTTRRSFQPAWRSQNSLCFETALMKHLTKATKPHARMRLRGGVDHSLGLIFFDMQSFRKTKKNLWAHTEDKNIKSSGGNFTATMRYNFSLKLYGNKTNSVTSNLAESCAAL